MLPHEAGALLKRHMGRGELHKVQVVNMRGRGRIVFYLSVPADIKRDDDLDRVLAAMVRTGHLTHGRLGVGRALCRRALRVLYEAELVSATSQGSAAAWLVPQDRRQAWLSSWRG